MIYSTPFKFRAPTPRTAMAQAFNGSSEYAHSQYRLTLAPYAKASISFWLNWASFADDDRLAVEYSSNYNRYAGTFIVVLGIAIMFYMKAYFFKPRGRSAAAAA